MKIREFLIIVMLCPGSGVLSAEIDHSATHQAKPDDRNVSWANRAALNLPSAVREGLQLTMREHLEAIGAIVAALAEEDFDRAASLAHEELGFPKHHVAMRREGGATFPPAYHELAMAHHEAAEALSTVIPTKNLKQILPHLQQTIHACVKCHQAYRLQD